MMRIWIRIGAEEVAATCIALLLTRTLTTDVHNDTNALQNHAKANTVEGREDARHILWQQLPHPLHREVAGDRPRASAAATCPLLPAIITLSW